VARAALDLPGGLGLAAALVREPRTAEGLRGGWAGGGWPLWQLVSLPVDPLGTQYTHKWLPC